MANTDGDVPKSIEDAQNHHLNAEPKKTSGKNGHSHGGGGGSSSQMNMRGVFLHVMGDALGSVVVIISALIMWRTEWEYKFYVDPGIYTYALNIQSSLIEKKRINLIVNTPTISVS